MKKVLSPQSLVLSYGLTANSYGLIVAPKGDA